MGAAIALTLVLSQLAIEPAPPSAADRRVAAFGVVLLASNAAGGSIAGGHVGSLLTRDVPGALMGATFGTVALGLGTASLMDQMTASEQSLAALAYFICGLGGTGLVLSSDLSPWSIAVASLVSANAGMLVTFASALLTDFQLSGKKLGLVWIAAGQVTMLATILLLLLPAMRAQVGYTPIFFAPAFGALLGAMLGMIGEPSDWLLIWVGSMPPGLAVFFGGFGIVFGIAFKNLQAGIGWGALIGAAFGYMTGLIVGLVGPRDELEAPTAFRITPSPLVIPTREGAAIGAGALIVF
jgi:hypothetical protein